MRADRQDMDRVVAHEELEGGRTLQSPSARHCSGVK